jgi:hypothetical protein
MATLTYVQHKPWRIVEDSVYRFILTSEVFCTKWILCRPFGILEHVLCAHAAASKHDPNVKTDSKISTIFQD